MSRSDAAAESIAASNDGIARQLEDLRRAGPLIFGTLAAPWFNLYLDPIIESLRSSELSSARHNEPTFNARKIMRVLIEAAKSLCLSDTTVTNYMERAVTVLSVEFTPAAWCMENFREVANLIARSGSNNKRGAYGSLSTSFSPSVRAASKTSPRQSSDKSSRSSSSFSGGRDQGSSYYRPNPPHFAGSGRSAPSDPPKGSSKPQTFRNKICIAHVQAILTPAKGVVCTNPDCAYDHDFGDIASLRGHVGAQNELHKRIDETFKSLTLKNGLFEAIRKL